MNRIAMKTIEYLPDFPFTTNRNNETVTVTKEETYDTFEMTMTLFDFGGEYTCWIGLDISGVVIPMVEIIRDELNKVTDKIHPDHLFVNGTHTHSGPNFAKKQGFGGMVMTKDDMADIVYDIAKKAAMMFEECEKELVPFEAEIKVTEIEGCYSNRNSLDGPCDKNVSLIRYKNKDTKETIGMWMNMSCHSTMIYPRSEKMSTDLVGNVRDGIAKHYNTKVMPTCGPQGDASTRLTRNRTDSAENDVKELHRITEGVLSQVLAEPEAFEVIDINRFDVKKYSISFEYKIDPSVTEKRLEKLQKEIEEETNKDQIRIKKSACRALSNQLGKTEFKGVIRGCAINMGELKWGVFPGELVGSLGLKVVRHEPKDHRLVVCYINDRVGYLVEREEYGKNFESLSSIIPVGMPEVITDMTVKELDQFDI